MKKIFSILIISFLFITYSPAQENKEIFASETEEPTFKEINTLEFKDLTPTQKAFNGEVTGAIIVKIIKNEALKKSGIQVGDILTHIDSSSIKSKKHAEIFLKTYKTTKGFSVLKVIRNGVKMDITVKFD